MRNNKKIAMQKVAKKIGTEAIEELLCLPPNKEPSQDLASIISDRFCNVLTFGLFENENSIFVLVNDMNSSLACVMLILMVLCILILIIHVCLTLILFN